VRGSAYQTAGHPFGFKDVVSIKHEFTVDVGRSCFLAYLEIWDFGLRVRWFENPAPDPDRHTSEPSWTKPWRVRDDAKTDYEAKGGGSALSQGTHFEASIWFFPTPPEGTSVLYIGLRDGQEEVAVQLPIN
jgi:hypothetical protein